MKSIQKKAKSSLSSAFRHLFEQGLFGDEPAGDDEKKEDEVGDDSADEEKDKPEEKDEEKEEEKEEEKPEELKVSPAEEARLADVVDQEIEAVLVDFETDARKAAVIDKKEMQEAKRRYSLKRVLLEVDEERDIDLKKFASEVARLVKNYDTLLDMKSIILNKAFSYIKYKYDENTEKALRDVLKQTYDLEPYETTTEEPEIPLAVGARTPT